jgi:hypothetical protein
MRIRAVAAVMCGLLFAWTTSLPAQTPEPLTDLITEWEAAFNEGNTETVAALYTEDAVRVPPGEPLIHGHSEIVARMAEYAGWKIKLTATGGMLGTEIGATWGEYELWGTVEGEDVSLSEPSSE